MYRKIVGIVLLAVTIGAFPILLASNILTSEENIVLNHPSLRKFGSYGELFSFLNTSRSYPPYYYGPIGGALIRTAAFPALEDSAGSKTPSYSTTNIQVEGVDEADIIKTDGQYIYIARENLIYIVKAYPAQEASVASTIKLNGTVIGIFIDEDKLVAFLQEYPDWRYSSTEIVKDQAHIQIYDIMNRDEPLLEAEISLDGYYYNSRMIGKYVYVVTTQPAYIREERIVLPSITMNNEALEIEATDVYYTDTQDYYHSFTTVVSIDIETGKIAHETFLLGYSTCLYVSQNNIYVATPKYENDTQKTEIHRIRVNSGDITYEASGEVPGYVLNQFSMDEYDENFRIATTEDRFSETFSQTTSASNVYVLNQNLTTIGKLEELAPNEHIYSARFMGARCYLVTFKKVDPLFVIDLEDPNDPRVLGKLKIPGYSDYLHPYDENHLIGIGKETVESEEGDFAWYQGVKISLFDVTDVEHPKEIAKYEIGDRGTDSPVLYDHKALLFDKELNLLVIPVLVAEIDEEKHPDGVAPYAYGDYVWQGAYVFKVTGESISFRGGVTHIDDSSELSKSGYYFYSEYSVKRSLYIDDYLYTVSDKGIKINTIAELTEVNEIELP